MRNVNSKLKINKIKVHAFKNLTTIRGGINIKDNIKSDVPQCPVCK